MKMKNIYMQYASLLIIFIFAGYLFGLSGLKLFLGYFFALFLPVYIILKTIDIGEIERIFFSFFIGLIYFPLLVWYINRIVPSLRVTILVTFILLILIGLFLRKRFRKS